MLCINLDDVALFIDEPKGWDDSANVVRRSDTRDNGVAPGGGILRAIAELVRVFDSELRPIRQSQPAFNPRFTAIQFKVFVVERNPLAVAWEESTAAVVPGAILAIAGPQISLVRVRDVQPYPIIVS